MHEDISEAGVRDTDKGTIPEGDKGLECVKENFSFYFIIKIRYF